MDSRLNVINLSYYTLETGYIVQTTVLFCYSYNFLKLNVYYEDLNFEVIEEDPEIEVRLNNCAHTLTHKRLSVISTS